MSRRIRLVPGSRFGRGMLPRTEVYVDGQPVGYFIEESDDLAYDPPEVTVGFYSADPFDVVVVGSREDAIAWLLERDEERED